MPRYLPALLVWLICLTACTGTTEDPDAGILYRLPPGTAQELATAIPRTGDRVLLRNDSLFLRSYKNPDRDVPLVLAAAPHPDSNYSLVLEKRTPDSLVLSMYRRDRRLRRAALVPTNDDFTPATADGLLGATYAVGDLAHVYFGRGKIGFPDTVVNYHVDLPPYWQEQRSVPLDGVMPGGHGYGAPVVPGLNHFVYDNVGCNISTKTVN